MMILHFTMIKNCVTTTRCSSARIRMVIGEKNETKYQELEI